METVQDKGGDLRRSKVLVLVLSMVGVLMVLVATSRYGVGTSPDSVTYVSTARNLLAGRGYVTFDGSPLVVFPPLFPTLLAGIGLGGIDPLEASRYVNAFCFGLVIFASGLWLLKHSRSEIVALIGSAAVLFSMPLLGVSVMAWSEPLFILFSLLFLLEIEEYLGNGRRLALVLSAIFAALATLERYIGVTVILTGLILLILQRRTALGRRFVNATTFGLIATLPIGLWVVRNVLVSSKLTGVRGPSPYTLVQHVYNALDVVTTWVLPSSSSSEAAGLSILPLSLRTIVQSAMLPPLPRFIIAILLFIAIVAVLVLSIMRSRNHKERSNLPQAAPMLCFLIVYPSVLITIAAVSWSREPINSRYMSPIYIPLISLVALAMDAGADFLGRRFRGLAPKRLLFAAFCIWLAYPLCYGVGRVVHLARDGAGGFSKPSWRNSALILYLKQHPPAGQVYTNSQYALYLLTGTSARLSPRKYTYQSHDPTSDDLVRFRESLASSDDTYLAWFENEDSSYLYDVQDLRSRFDVEVVVTTPSGVLYRVKPE
jgi:hypothetical protein